MRIESDVRSPADTRGPHPVLYWSLTGLFLLIFGFSGIWTLVDPAGARADTLALGFPAFTVYPLAIAKLLGLAAILSRKWRLLTGLAFAGFFYDTVLALGTHLSQGDLARAPLAALGLAATVGAFWVHQRRYPPTG